jgi:hypothetical protein
MSDLSYVENRIDDLYDQMTSYHSKMNETIEALSRKVDDLYDKYVIKADTRKFFYIDLDSDCPTNDEASRIKEIMHKGEIK